MKHPVNMILMLGLLGIASSNTAAKPLTKAEECVIQQTEVAAAYAQCLDQARIEGLRQQLHDEEADLLLLECEASMFEEAAAHELSFGDNCDTTSDTLESRDENQLTVGVNSNVVVKPQIPEHDFEWNGRFVGNAAKVADPQLEATLTIRGKHQDGYFNVYMAQGGPGEKLWVENLLFEGKLYSFTHKWHSYIDPATHIEGNCFENTAYNPADPANSLPITVQDLNGILKNSRFVGLERTGGKPMNHFRATCLSTAGIPEIPLFLWIPFKIFSDIYVPPGRAWPWYRWLQTADGVGPDREQDEWFLFDSWNRHPADIVKPTQCDKVLSIKAQQTPCSNLKDQREN